MKRIRALANMELVDNNGDTLQIGSETYFECDKIVKHQDGYVDFYLKNGNVIYGVEWDDKLFENHGVPEEVKVNLTISEEEWDDSNVDAFIIPKPEEVVRYEDFRENLFEDTKQYYEVKDNE